MPTQVKLQSSKRPKTKQQFLCLGFGMVAQTLAPLLRGNEHHGDTPFQISATIRHEKSAEPCRQYGVTPILIENGNTALLRAAQTATHLLISAAPTKPYPCPSLAKAHSDPFITLFEQTCPAEDIASLFPNLQWAGYLSATSVYGDRDGHYVFEDEALHPSTDRGRARVEAELAWLETGLPVHIFRLASIYGTGRNPVLRAQNPNAKIIVKPDHISSRIHADDIANALIASMASPNPTQIYNLADDHPAPPHDVMRYAANLVGANLPEIDFNNADMSDMAKSFYQERRRTSNHRAKAELGWSPKYADYQQGLSAIWAEIKNKV